MFLLKNGEIAEETSSYSSESCPTPVEEVKVENKKKVSKRMQSSKDVKDQPFVLQLMRLSLEKKMSLKKKKPSVKSSLNLTKLLFEAKQSPRKDDSVLTTD